jgi:hypothetical protein
MKRLFPDGPFGGIGMVITLTAELPDMPEHLDTGTIDSGQAGEQRAGARHVIRSLVSRLLHICWILYRRAV